MDLLDRMLGHDAWATDILFERCGELSEEQLNQAFDIGHGTVLATLTHLVNVIAFWTAGIEERPAEIDWDAKPNLTELAALHTKRQARFQDVARAARESKRLDVLFTDVNGYQQSIAVTILHQLYHNVIHRSEVQHMLHRLGVTEIWDGDPQEWEFGMRERGLIS